ncbi:hypothetical protein FRC17_003026, partial [Serendipita sp. 399]
APLTLRAVCRSWQAIVDETRRAWSYLEITDTTSPAFCKSWIQHCAHVPYHLTVHPSVRKAVVEAALEAEECSPVCLSLFNSLHVLVNNFPNLEVLRLGPANRATKLRRNKRFKDEKNRSLYALRHRADASNSLLTSIRFPKLRALYLNAPPVCLLKQVAKASEFPPLLQELHILIDSEHWRPIVALTAGSLVKLGLRMSNRHPSLEGDRIDLPRLTDLSLSLRRLDKNRSTLEDHASRNLNFATPTLKNYREQDSVGMGSFPLYPGISTVKTVHFEGQKPIDWLGFDSLEEVVLTTPAVGVERQLSPLLEDIAVCPSLCSIKLVLYGEENMEIPEKERVYTALKALGERRRVVVEVQLPSPDYTKYHVEAFERFTYCSCNTGDERAQDRFNENQ